MSHSTLLHKSMERTLFGHPIGLYVCFLTEMWERFSFYGMKALLLLYVTKYHLFSDETGLNLLGAYGGLVYAVPVIGGLLADRYLGMRKAVIFGGVLLVLGHLGMAFEGSPASTVNGVVERDGLALQVFYFSLALIIMGVGFLKPNISTIVGKLYGENDPRGEAGFTIFYAGINLGAFLSALICGWLGETYGWRYGFGLAGLGMIVGLITFIVGQPYLYGHAEPRNPKQLSEKIFGPFSREHLIYLASLGGIGLVWLLIQSHSMMIKIIPGSSWGFGPVTLSMHLTSAVLLVGVLYFMFTKCSKIEREQMFVVLALIVFGTIFFAMYEQTAGSWTLFSDRTMNREFFGFEPTAGQLQSLGALFIFFLTPIFAWLWPKLDKLGLNPSKPAKAGWGIIFAALAFFVLAWGAQHPDETGKAALLWFVLAYFVLEIGEIMLSPIGLSAVTQLSVPRVVSLMMGAWFLGTSYAEIVAAQLGQIAAIDPEATKELDIAEALIKYDQLFMFSAKVSLAAGVVTLIVSPLLKRWMHGVK
jgi:proton-dependent oligopeptide transporter, POT family